MSATTPKTNRLATFKKLAPQTASTGKKAIAETNSNWKRKHLNIVDADEKEEVVKKIRGCMGSGAKVGKDLIVGYNSVMRSIESGRAQVVCVAHDGHPVLLKAMVEAAKARGISTLAVPKLNQSIRKELNLKSASCFAIEKVGTGEHAHDDQQIGASIDSLREYLLGL